MTLSVSGLSGSQIGLGRGVNIWKERKWIETGLTALSGRLAIIEEGSKGSYKGITKQFYQNNLQSPINFGRGPSEGTEEFA